MTEEQKNAPFGEAWAKVLSAADALPEVKVSVTNEPERTSLGDRLAFLALEGYMPLLALTALLLSLAAADSSTTIWLTNLLAAPLLVFIFRPLVRRRHGLLVSGLWLVLIPSFLSSAAVSATARILEHRLSTGQMHIEFSALALQLSLEKLLTQQSLGLIFSTLLALSFIQRWLHIRFPWVQLPHSPSRWRWLPLGLLTLGVVALGAKLGSTISLSSAEKDWMRLVESRRQERPFSHLPQDSEDRYWRELREKLDERLDANKTPTITGGDYWTPENRKVATRGLPSPRLHSHPPENLAEAKAASYYLLTLGDFFIADNIWAVLESLNLRYGMRPYYGTGDFSWLYQDILRRLATAEEKVELQELRQRLVTMRNSLGDLEHGLQERAYHVLTLDPDQLAHSKSIGWKAVDHLVTPSKATKGWAYNANPKPRALRVLNWEFASSPTELGGFYERRRLLRRWVGLQQELKPLSWSERMKRLQVEQDSLPLSGTMEDTFWDELLQWKHTPQELSHLQQAEILVLLKLHRLEHGQYPQKLEEIAPLLDFPEELGKFEWDPATRVLGYSDLQQSVEIPAQ